MLTTIEGAGVIVVTGLFAPAQTNPGRALVSRGARIAVVAGKTVSEGCRHTAQKGIATIVGARACILAHKRFARLTLAVGADIIARASVPIVTRGAIHGVRAPPNGLATIVGARVFVFARRHVHFVETAARLAGIGAAQSVIVAAAAE